MATQRIFGVTAIAAVLVLILLQIGKVQGPATVHRAGSFDVSPPLVSLRGSNAAAGRPDCDPDASGCGVSPNDADDEEEEAEEEAQTDGAPAPKVANGVAVEQKSQGFRPPAALIASFNGLGFGFVGPQGTTNARNPSDNSLAVGPNQIVEIVNSTFAVYTKTGKVLSGPVATNTIFTGFGGQCEPRPNGDAVVRYDQLAERWLFVMPIFRREAGQPQGTYAMCYAVSVGPDPLGPYYRYEFKRPLFPDYPRPAIWPDGYYIPTSTGDNVIQKHACVADRNKMLQGLPATEQCIIIDDVNFLNNADIDGRALPPPGAPNIMMATGGTQLHQDFEDDGIYVWKFHVDWEKPANTAVSGPVKIPVARYHYLCNGQLTSCVPQPGTDRRLDAQGDKLMQRLVYRNVGGRESIVALHSVNTETGGGGVRWYEFRLNENRDPYLYQQSTYAPDGLYRWMGSIAMDQRGNIGMGYSFGGTPNFAGQRFSARLAGDPLGVLTFQETVLVRGEASQKNTLRWEDYATTAIDPSDDCTFWYVGDYLKTGAETYTTRIGSFRLPGCLRATVSGVSFFDHNHNGKRDPGEPGIAGRRIDYAGAESGKLTTDASGVFRTSLPADAAYADPTYTVSEQAPADPLWTRTSSPSATVRLAGGKDATGLQFGEVCVVKNTGGAGVPYWSSSSGLRFWSKNSGEAVLNAHDPAWRTLINSKLNLANADGSRFTVSGSFRQTYGQLRTWLRNGDGPNVSVELALTALNVAFGAQDGNAMIHDPIVGDWAPVNTIIDRVSVRIAARSDPEKYKTVLQQLNSNTAMVTPSSAANCGSR